MTFDSGCAYEACDSIEKREGTIALFCKKCGYPKSYHTLQKFPTKEELLHVALLLVLDKRGSGLHISSELVFEVLSNQTKFLHVEETTHGFLLAVSEEL